MTESRARRVYWLLPIALIGLALVAVGCGDDDDSATTSATAEATTAGGPLTIETVQANLEAAGYTVEEETSEPLIRRDDGEIVQPDAKLVVTGGDLTDDVSVYSLGSPEDVAAMEAFVAGSDVSLVIDPIFIQSAAAGEAQTVADAAQG
jgi:hypothetical protein